MPGQAVEDRRQGAEQRGVDAEERPLRRGLAVRSGRAQNQMVGHVGEGAPKRARRFGPPDSETFAGNALARYEALGRLLVQAVADPQAQLVFAAVEGVGKVAAVDLLDEQPQVLGVAVGIAQDVVEAGVRSEVEIEDPPPPSACSK